MDVFLTQPRRLPLGPILAFCAAILIGFVLARLPLLVGIGLVGATAVLLLTIIQPLLGLGIALLLGPLGAIEALLFPGLPLDSGQLLLLLALAAWIGRGLRDGRIVIPRTPLNIPLLLFIFVALLTLLDAPSYVHGFKETLKWIEICLIMWMVVDLAGSRQPMSTTDSRFTPHAWRLWILIMLLLAGVSQALIGIWQFGLRQDGPEHFLVLGRFYRAYGTFEQPNPFGGYINLSLLLALGALVGVLVAFWLKGRGKQVGGSDDVLMRPWVAAFLIVITAVTGLAVLFSWSRGAWLGLAAGTAVFVLFLPKKRWQGVMLVAAAAMLGMSLLLTGIFFNRIPSGVIERATSSFSEDLRFDDVRGVDINDANYAVLERLAHWQAALEMARYNLWLGVGFGNYEPAYPDYMLINWPDALGHAHNYYINLLAEIGVLGLAAYLILWAAIFWQTIKLLPILDWPQRGIALGLLAVWTALSVHHLVDKLYVNNIYIHLGVLLGLQQLLALGEDENDVSTIDVCSS